MTKYFTLTNSNGTFTKRFRAIADGYIENLEKKQDIQTTLEGALDVSMGSIFATWQYVVRVRHTEEDGSYGTYADLKQFYKYNNANGTPSNILTLTDHYGQSHSVVFVDRFAGKPFAAMIEGVDAWFFVNVNLFCVDAEEDS
jgi:hypothetical protein